MDIGHTLIFQYAKVKPLTETHLVTVLGYSGDNLIVVNEHFVATAREIGGDEEGIIEGVEILNVTRVKRSFVEKQGLNLETILGMLGVTDEDFCEKYLLEGKTYAEIFREPSLDGEEFLEKKKPTEAVS